MPPLSCPILLAPHPLFHPSLRPLRTMTYSCSSSTIHPLAFNNTTKLPLSSTNTSKPKTKSSGLVSTTSTRKSATKTPTRPRTEPHNHSDPPKVENQDTRCEVAHSQNDLLSLCHDDLDGGLEPLWQLKMIRCNSGWAPNWKEMEIDYVVHFPNDFELEVQYWLSPTGAVKPAQHQWVLSVNTVSDLPESVQTLLNGYQVHCNVLDLQHDGLSPLIVVPDLVNNSANRVIIEICSQTDPSNCFKMSSKSKKLS
ncbi:hypothetical protein BDK51DRAFT_32697 [Blyttiomyces helicus]|uniref:Uncharacterized protein n=1 Tax=Blyttiomyces helicus TaxID=388810 RepID=A0A4P9WQY4_9FUNG|nr:hypothetical protein BDK51DRAFT_32697 [Blyttiomyces helicus]|eukprot:RKO94815.1 hypothetical protein BDK51DRAFT_32697 [Blyttiomyces helicus]